MDCFEDKELAVHYFLKPVQLIDITIIPDAELMTHKKLALLEIIQKHIFKRDLALIMKPIVKLINSIYLPPELVNSLVNYSLRHSNKYNRNKLIEVFNKNEYYHEAAMTIAEELIEEGIEKGLKKGQSETILLLAEKMLTEGASITFVKKVTGLSDGILQNLNEKIIF